MWEETLLLLKEWGRSPLNCFYSLFDHYYLAPGRVHCRKYMAEQDK